MSEIIKVQNLVKNYDDTEVLDHINISFEKGKVYTIIGPSGSGKSTLLRCINQLETVTSGDIIFHGNSIIGSDTNLNSVRSKIGMVFQSFNLFENLNVVENCTLGPIHVLKRDKMLANNTALENLAHVGMGAFQDRNVSTLSGGQKQRVAIARTLSMNPEIILFDEPTSSLDPEMVKDVHEVISNVIDHNMCFIIVTHEMDFAKQVSDHIIFMDDGRIIEEGTPDEIFNNPKSDRLKQFIQ